MTNHQNVRIHPEILKRPNPTALSLLGPWKTHLPHYNKIFTENACRPFHHVVIDNFLREDVAERVLARFPEDDAPIWYRYQNPLEKKLACDDLTLLPKDLSELIIVLNAPEVIRLVEEISGLPNLEADPYLHGGGVHCHPRDSKLDIHLDYSVHPRHISPRKERRLNLILYLNKDWRPDYKGELQLWDKHMKKCVVKVPPAFNRALLFQTSDLAYHGLPEPIKCPPGHSRKSVAIYYLAPVRENATLRYKAQFFPRPGDPPSEYLNKLREIRPYRRLTEEDLTETGEKEDR